MSATFAGKPEVTSVLYQNPWSPIPNDTQGNGIILTIKNPAGYVLVGRVMQGDSSLVVNCSPLSSSQLILKPPCPLADEQSYYIQAQFVPTTAPYKPDKIIASIVWTDSSTINIPVLSTTLKLHEGLIEIADTTLKATFIWTNNFPITAYLQMYASDYQNPTFGSCFDNSLTLEYNYSSPPSTPYTAVLRPLIPLISPPPSPWPPNQILWPSIPFAVGSGITYTLPTQSPTITAVNYDGTIVSVIWAALTIPAGAEPATYELLLTSTSNGVTATTTFLATPAGGTIPLPIPGSLSDSYTVSARVNYGVIKGPSSTPVPVLIGSVDNIVQTTDASTGFAALTWDDPGDSPGGTVTYNLIFSGSDAPSNPSAQSETNYTLSAALTPNSAVTISISKTVTTTSPAATTTGPSSPPCKLGTSQPVKLNAEYDGTTVSLSWQALVKRVSEYTVTLFVSDTPNTISFPAQSNATSFSFKPADESISIASTDTLTVTLQANLGGDAGPGIPTSQMPVIFTPAYFLTATEQTVSAPLIYSAPTLATLNQTQPASITLYLPSGNYLPAGKTLTQPVNYPLTNPIFTLAANAGNTAYPYKLTINSTAWNTNIIRLAVQTAYVTFLENAETAGVTPWGISVLQEAIARHMPQTFEETLYYNYGLDLVKGCADLRPGMVLRVMPSDFIVVPDTDRDPGILYLDGYMNGAPMDYDIGSYTSSSGWMVGFDAFLSRLVAGGALAVKPLPSSDKDKDKYQYVGGAGEAADLYSPAFQQPFYRLFIPTTLLKPINDTSSQPHNQFALAAAASYTSLEGTSNGATGNTNIYFNGRSIIKLCIRVTINGNEAVVPIGTTVANILERASRVPPKSGVTLTGISLKRAIGQTDTVDTVDTVGSSTCDVGRSYAVRFDYQKLPAYSNGQCALDLPLLHGDRLSFEV